MIILDSKREAGEGAVAHEEVPDFPEEPAQVAPSSKNAEPKVAKSEKKDSKKNDVSEEVNPDDIPF